MVGFDGPKTLPPQSPSSPCGESRHCTETASSQATTPPTARFPTTRSPTISWVRVVSLRRATRRSSTSSLLTCKFANPFPSPIGTSPRNESRKRRELIPFRSRAQHRELRPLDPRQQLHRRGRHAVHLDQLHLAGLPAPVREAEVDGWATELPLVNKQTKKEPPRKKPKRRRWPWSPSFS